MPQFTYQTIFYKFMGEKTSCSDAGWLDISIGCLYTFFYLKYKLSKYTLSILKNNFGDKHRDVFLTIKYISDVLKDLGDISISKVYYEHALTIAKKLYKPGHKHIIELEERIRNLDSEWNSN